MLLQARTSFVANHRGVLGFFKGEQFLVVDGVLGAPKWNLVINYIGELGYIPATSDLVLRLEPASKKKEQRFIDHVIDTVHSSAKNTHKLTEKYVILLRLLYKLRYLISQFGPDWSKKIQIVRTGFAKTGRHLKMLQYFERVGGNAPYVSSSHTIHSSVSLLSTTQKDSLDLIGPPDQRLIFLLGMFGASTLDSIDEKCVSEYLGKLYTYVKDMRIRIQDALEDYGERIAQGMVNYFIKEKRAHLKYTMLSLINDLSWREKLFANQLINTDLALILIDELQNGTPDTPVLNQVVITEMLNRLFTKMKDAGPLRPEVLSAVDQNFINFTLECIESPRDGATELPVSLTQLLLQFCESGHLGYILGTALTSRTDLKEFIEHLGHFIHKEGEPGPATNILRELLESHSREYFTEEQLNKLFDLLTSKIYAMVSHEQWHITWLTVLEHIVTCPNFLASPVQLTDLQSILINLKARDELDEEASRIVSSLLPNYGKKGSSNTFLGMHSDQKLHGNFSSETMSRLF